jgi:O-antigen ligase
MWILFALAVERVARTAAGQRSAARCGSVFAALTVVVIAVAIVDNRYGAAYYAHHFSGGGQSPHGLVEIAVLALPIVLLSLVRQTGRLVAAVILAALCVEVVVSFVRTGYLGLAVIVLGCAWLGIRRGRAGFAALAVIAAIATAVTAFALSDKIASRLSDLSYVTAGGQAEREAGAGRVGFWVAVTDASLSGVSGLIVGEGAASSIAINQRINGQAAAAHNDFVEMLGTGGLILLFSYLGLLTWAFGSFRRLRGDPRQSPAARDVGALGLVACSAFVVLSFFNGIATSAASLPFALMLGLARGMCATPGRTFIDARAWTP